MFDFLFKGTRLTHIIYVGALFDQEGTFKFFNREHFDETNKVVRKYSDIKFLVSIGGWLLFNIEFPKNV